MTDKPKSTPAANWREQGKPDPHGTNYNCERAALCLGDMTDDELANAVFIHGNERLDLAAVMAGATSPIVYLTAAKERIRWLSRRLEEVRKLVPPGSEGTEPTAYGEEFRKWVEGLFHGIITQAFRAKREYSQKDLSYYLPSLVEGYTKTVMKRMEPTARRLEWKTMDSAPKDGTPILALCCHEDSVLFDFAADKFTVYGMYAEEWCHVPDGMHVIEWGGGSVEGGGEEAVYEMPDWWFLNGGDFEVVANPVLWAEAPVLPEKFRKPINETSGD